MGSHFISYQYLFQKARSYRGLTMMTFVDSVLKMEIFCVVLCPRAFHQECYRFILLCRMWCEMTALNFMWGKILIGKTVTPEEKSLLSKVRAIFHGRSWIHWITVHGIVSRSRWCWLDLACAAEGQRVGVLHLSWTEDEDNKRASREKRKLIWNANQRR